MRARAASHRRLACVQDDDGDADLVVANGLRNEFYVSRTCEDGEVRDGASLGCISLPTNARLAVASDQAFECDAHYKGSLVRTLCELCPRGQQRPFGELTCNTCPTGSKQTVAGTLCDACEEGKYVDFVGSVLCFRTHHRVLEHEHGVGTASYATQHIL